jgi:hypothetical protein
VNVQFDWWLLIVGFVIGAGLTGLVLAELHRREDDLTARERETEAAWIAADMTAHGIPADGEAVAEVLRLHRLYLAGLPADEPELDDFDADRIEGEPLPGTSTVVRTDRAGQDRDRPGSPVASGPDAREDARTLG